MPDGVRARKFPVGLEEENTDEVQKAADLELRHGGEFVPAQDDGDGGPDGDDNIENRLQALVAFVEELLIDDAEGGEHPDHVLEHADDVRMRGVPEIEPRVVRAGDEDVDHRAVHPMQNVLQHAVLVAVENAVEGGADAEQQQQGRSVDERDHHLVLVLRAEQQEEGSVSGGEDPKAMRDYVGDVLDLQGFKVQCHVR